MDSKDRFERFVEENKLDFGPDHKSPDVWSRIQKIEADKKSKSINWNIWYSRAAAFIIVFTLSYFFHDFVNNLDGTNSQQSQSASPAMQELYEADQYYSARISERKEELFRLAGISSGLRNDVNSELADLDAVLNDLKTDLQDNADNAEVIEAMMQNYRLKLEILEDLLTQVKNTNNENNQNEKGISI